MSDKIRVMYARTHVGKGGKKYALFVPEARVAQVSDWQSLVKSCSMYEAPKRRLVPGGIYESTGTLSEDGGVATLGISALQLVEQPSHPLAPAWDMEDRALASQAKSEQLEKRLLAHPQAVRELRGLQEVFTKCDYETRSQFAHIIAGMLWKGLPK